MSPRRLLSRNLRLIAVAHLIFVCVSLLVDGRRTFRAQLTDPHLKGCPGRGDVQTSWGSELGSPS
jgi:hypothetical protein